MFLEYLYLIVDNLSFCSKSLADEYEHPSLSSLYISRLERAKKLQEQKEKDMLEKQQHQEVPAGETLLGYQLHLIQSELNRSLISNHFYFVCVLFLVPAPLLSDTVVVAAAAATHPVLNVAALLASGTQVTPQIAMAAQMAALQAKTLAETGIAVPSYYNPSAVNPLKFAEQEKKRKKLWQGKKEGVRFYF